MNKKVLVIEDNQDIAYLVKLHLSDAQFAVDCVFDGKSGLQQVLRAEHDIVVLDLMLPGLDGMEICRRLRASNNLVPVLMLTAKGTELDRVLGLEIGADDYLTKPFSIRELVARVRAICRRMDHQAARESSALPDSIQVGELAMDAGRRVVSLAGRPVDLTAREFDLLWHFASNPGRVYSRSQLLDSIWGYAHEGYEHTVNSHINRLRAKIESNPAEPAYILTVWGVGYKFAEPAAH